MAHTTRGQSFASHARTLLRIGVRAPATPARMAELHSAVELGVVDDALANGRDVLRVWASLVESRLVTREVGAYVEGLPMAGVLDLLGDMMDDGVRDVDAGVTYFRRLQRRLRSGAARG